MTLQEQIDALPEWPKTKDGATLTNAGLYFLDRSNAALARLAPARAWITDATHHDGCNSRRYDQDGSWPSGDPCDCGRDALLKALEVPHG